MRYSSFYTPLLLLGAGVFLTSCQGEDGPVGPAGTVQANSIIGFIRAYDEFGASLDQNGSTVTVDGITPAIQAVTDNAGRFELPGVPVGTYNLTVSRAGLATTRRIGVPHTGGTQPTNLNPIFQSAVSSSVITNLTISPPTQGNYFARGSFDFTNPSIRNDYRILMVASATLPVTQQNAVPVGGVYATNMGSNNFNLYIDNITDRGFVSGQTVYIAAVGVPIYDFPYTDPVSGFDIYPGRGALSNPTTLRIP